LQAVKKSAFQMYSGAIGKANYQPLRKDLVEARRLRIAGDDGNDEGDTRGLRERH